MATKAKSATDSGAASVSRTFRMAVKVGEDYLTLEETITLPVTASDEDIQHAVDLGWRMYTQQRDAAEAQILEARESYSGDNERVALPSQLQRIAELQQRIGWNAHEMERFFAERGLDAAMLSRQQAHQVVQLLRRVYDDAQRQNAPAQRRQIADIQRIGSSLGIDVHALVTQQFGDDVTLEQLTHGEATRLLQSLEKHRRGRSER